MLGQKHDKLDPFFEQPGEWQTAYALLREISLGCSLTEEVKWKHPCYTWSGKNVCILGHFTEGPRVSFFAGVLLDDPDSLLEKIGQNTRAGRLVRFHDIDDLIAKRSALEALVSQNKSLIDQGIKVDFERDRDDQELPEELIEALEVDTGYQEAWDALTPGRRRGWLLHFNGAKQPKTKVSRIEKARTKVFIGKGWNEW